MRRLRIPSLAATAALAAIVTWPTSGSAAQPAACTPARIGQSVRCLLVGQRCDPRYGHVYKLYEFTCKRDRKGHYELHARIFIGPPAVSPKAG
jgi:hypothetical protein